MTTIIHSNFEGLRNAQTLRNNVPSLSKSDIHIWSINRKVYDDQKSYTEYLLDENELSRAQKFRFKKDHDPFVIGRFLTKVLMAYYTNVSPENVKIIPDSCGKPTSDLKLFFNLSHSGDQLLLGFSHSPIGVDIEKEDPRVDTKSVGKSNFSKIEFKILMNASNEQKLSTFFEIWTKKESLIKGIGRGLSIPLTNFNVTAQDGKVDWNLPSENIYGDWYVQKFERNQGYMAAFATQRSMINLMHFCLESDLNQAY